MGAHPFLMMGFCGLIWGFPPINYLQQYQLLLGELMGMVLLCTREFSSAHFNVIRKPRVLSGEGEMPTASTGCQAFSRLCRAHMCLWVLLIKPQFEWHLMIAKPPFP